MDNNYLSVSQMHPEAVHRTPFQEMVHHLLTVHPTEPPHNQLSSVTSSSAESTHTPCYAPTAH
ncbi:hypothetical protein Hanom_Chr15g01353111 [Helianthus anomalus]